MIKTHKKDIFVFLAICFFVNLLVFGLNPHPDLDFFNYHLYNGWALVNDRLNTDFMPATFRSYINPYLDALKFLVIDKLSAHPYLTISVLSLDHTVFLFLIYKISEVVLAPFRQKYLYIALSIVYVFCAPILLYLAGYGYNDIIIADFILLSFFILIKILFDESKNSVIQTAFAGAVLGIAFG